MTRRIAICAAALALFAATAPSANAQPIPDRGLTFNEVVAWLQNAGYKAEVQTASDGKANIYSSAGGNVFHISMYDCKEGGACGSMQFWVGFNTKGAFSPARTNTLNRSSRWVRVYVDDVNDPWLEMDVDLTPGGTYQNLNEEFRNWRESLARFKQQNPM